MKTLRLVIVVAGLLTVAETASAPYVPRVRRTSPQASRAARSSGRPVASRCAPAGRTAPAGRSRFSWATSARQAAASAAPPCGSRMAGSPARPRRRQAARSSFRSHWRGRRFHGVGHRADAGRREARRRQAGLAIGIKSMGIVGARLAFVVVALTFGATGCSADGRGDGSDNEHVARNEAILRTIPVFPGARRVALSSGPYYANDGEGAPVGYVTRASYRLPRGTTKERVVRFYTARLRGTWSLSERLDGPVLGFRRGRSLVSLNLENRELLEISVDADSYFLKP
jgi:hypothetical protein